MFLAAPNILAVNGHPSAQAATGRGNPKMPKLKQPRAIPLPATNKGVLIYCGNGGVCGNTPTGNITFNALRTYYTSLGAGPVLQTATWPTSLAPYRLIYIVMPTQAFTMAQVSALQAAISAGQKRIVLVGDTFNVWGSANRAIGSALVKGILPSSFVAFDGTPDDTACRSLFPVNYDVRNPLVIPTGFFPLVDNVFPLTGDLPDKLVKYQGAATLERGTNFIPIIKTTGGYAPIVVAYRPPTTSTVPGALPTQVRGTVVVTGDSGLFSDRCASNGLAGNQTFWKNLFVVFDDDDDGLLNDWEDFGYDAGDNGTVDVNLPALGADSKRRDIFVEVDWMTGCPAPARTPDRKPKPEALQMVVDAFAKAPLRNPDGSLGITLHVNALPGNNSIGCDTLVNWPTEFQNLKNMNFSSSRQKIFHYNIWGVDSSIGGGGLGEIPGDDFLITLVRTNLDNGTALQQAGTFMHELGHNLNLRHGGLDDINYKPNYLSIMNYTFEFRGLRINSQDGNIDYSTHQPKNGANPLVLNENGLNEASGLKAQSDNYPNNYGTYWRCGNLPNRPFTAPVNNVNGAINWNCQGAANETLVRADINGDTVISNLITPPSDWLAIKLASPSRPGIIASGESFSRKQRFKQTQNIQPPVAKEMGDFEMWSLIREDVTSRGEFDPSELPNMKAEAVPQGVEISWSKVASSRIQRIRDQVPKYEVYRQEYKYPLQDPTLIGTTSELSFIDRQAIKGRTYTYYVKTYSIIQKGNQNPDNFPTWGMTSIGWENIPWLKP